MQCFLGFGGPDDERVALQADTRDLEVILAAILLAPEHRRVMAIVMAFGLEMHLFLLAVQSAQAVKAAFADDVTVVEHGDAVA